MNTLYFTLASYGYGSFILDDGTRARVADAMRSRKKPGIPAGVGPCSVGSGKGVNLLLQSLQTCSAGQCLTFTGMIPVLILI